MLKPIPRVLVRAARSLHHAVKRQHIHHDYLSHLSSCPFGLGSATQMRRLGLRAGNTILIRRMAGEHYDLCVGMRFCEAAGRLDTANP